MTQNRSGHCLSCPRAWACPATTVGERMRGGGKEAEWRGDGKWNEGVGRMEKAAVRGQTCDLLQGEKDEPRTKMRNWQEEIVNKHLPNDRWGKKWQNTAVALCMNHMFRSVIVGIYWKSWPGPGVSLQEIPQDLCDELSKHLNHWRGACFKVHP